VSVSPRSPRRTETDASETWPELLGAYGQSVGAVIGVFGLFITAGAALVGLYAFAAASAPADDTLDFAREFSQLLQAVAWTKVDGSVVHWRDVLLIQTTVIGLALLTLTASALATLLHAQRGRAVLARRAHATLFGSAYVVLAALISIPCIALASGYPESRFGIFCLSFGVLWLLVILSGVPTSPELVGRARLNRLATLWLIVGAAVAIGLLSGAMDGATALAVLIAGGILAPARRAPAVLRSLWARLA
jgi:hypothetical protein